MVSSTTDSNNCMWNINKQELFNCTALLPCSITCNGPQASIIEATTTQCACMSEWYAHATLIYFSLAIAVYVSLNISRSSDILVHVVFTNFLSFFEKDTVSQRTRTT